MELFCDVKKYICEPCIFSCNGTGDWKRHISTGKHCKQNCSTNTLKPREKKFICELCEKKYDSRNGLWKHKKKCFPKEELSDKQLINFFLIKKKKSKKIIKL